MKVKIHLEQALKIAEGLKLVEAQGWPMDTTLTDVEQSVIVLADAYTRLRGSVLRMLEKPLVHSFKMEKNKTLPVIQGEFLFTDKKTAKRTYRKEMTVEQVAKEQGKNYVATNGRAYGDLGERSDRPRNLGKLR